MYVHDIHIFVKKMYFPRKILFRVVAMYFQEVSEKICCANEIITMWLMFIVCKQSNKTSSNKTTNLSNEN